MREWELCLPNLSEERGALFQEGSMLCGGWRGGGAAFDAGIEGWIGYEMVELV